MALADTSTVRRAAPSVPSGSSDVGRRVAAVAAGAVLVVVGVAGLHNLIRAGDSAGELVTWAGMLLVWFTALGGGVKLASWGLNPVTTELFERVKDRLSESGQAVVAALAVAGGGLSLFWVLRGGYSTWWQQLSGETGWTLLLGAGQMLVAVAAGAALFTGARFLTGLAREVVTGAEHGAGGAGHRLPNVSQREGSEGSEESLWHPGLLAALIGGGLGLVLLAAGIAPRLYVWITGPQVLPAVAAVAVVLVWAVGSNLGWWHGLSGLYRWATAASQKTLAAAAVVALLAFSAGGLGLGWFTPATVAVARAACPPDCGGPGGVDGPPGGGQIFQPPSQGGPSMPDYQGGNYGSQQAPLDQNGSVSIYNTQAPGGQQVPSQSGGQGQQEPPFRANPDGSWQARNGEWSPPNYETATPFTQGPGRPNPDFPGNQHGGQPNTGNQGAQQAPQQQQQPAQQPSQQQPQQRPDSQRVDDLTRQLNEQQQQNGRSQQRIEDLTRQLDQQKQQQNNQKLPRLPEQGKKKDQQDQDRDQQSGNNDVAALLLGAASTTRRRKPEQQQGPDTQALTQDGGQLAQSLPGDVVNTVSDGVNLGQSAGSAAQNFGSAAQAGASLASSAQSGAVNPMDAVAAVQGVSGGISDTADAVNSGAQIASTWLNNAGQVAQLAADANPQLQPQAEQVQQLTQAGGQVADLTGQVASGVSQVSGLVNTASSLGTSGMPDTSGVSADVQSVDLQSGEVPEGVATAVDFKQAPADPVGPDVPEPPVPSRVSQLPSAQQMKSMTDIEILGLSKEAQAALTAYDARFPKVIPQPQYPAYLEGRAPLEAAKAAYDAQLASRGINFGPLGGEVEYDKQTGSILRFRDYPAKPGDPTPSWKELGTPEPAPTVPQEPQPSLTEPPTSVSGYRGHAMDRMQERGWTRGQIEDAVDNPKQPAIFQPDKGTWLYRGQNGINVAVNPYGEVVTVF